ncbi:MAG: hypothetical protein H6636_03705 [Anaerolineales bacterium]|nr:hypothetical protein [Anaerolineales bacterium]
MDDLPVEPAPEMDDGGDIPNITSLPVEEGKKTHTRKSPASAPALTIHIQSWATPVIGVLMLVLGLAAGFYARPLFDTPLLPVTETPSAEIAPTAEVPAAQNQAAPTQSSQAQAEQQQQLMDLVISQTRHFEGNENAPVTLIEFSDFQ